MSLPVLKGHGKETDFVLLPEKRVLAHRRPRGLIVADSVTVGYCSRSRGLLDSIA